jgi:hypothetical protein
MIIIHHDPMKSPILKAANGTPGGANFPWAPGAHGPAVADVASGEPGTGDGPDGGNAWGWRVHNSGMINGY